VIKINIDLIINALICMRNTHRNQVVQHSPKWVVHPKTETAVHPAAIGVV